MARLHASLQSAVSTDFRQDISLEWRPNPLEKRVEKAAVVSAANHYARSPANDSLFRKAGEAVKKKNYAQAGSPLSKIVDADPKESVDRHGSVLVASGREVALSDRAGENRCVVTAD